MNEITFSGSSMTGLAGNYGPVFLMEMYINLVFIYYMKPHSREFINSVSMYRRN